jgi:hypothetical protein
MTAIAGCASTPCIDCGRPITMASVMVDEIRLRARAHPLDEPKE